MTTVVAPMCAGCTRYRRDADILACDAFPDGIPDAIVKSAVDHRQPVPGDHGIVFEPSSDADARYADTLFSSWVLTPELAYSPGQKRDTQGRFGSGGGSGGTITSLGSGSAGSSEAGEENKGRIQDDGDRQFQEAQKGLGPPGTWGSDVGTASALVSQRLKDQAMREVGADLDAAFPDARLVAAAGNMRDAGTLHGDTPGEQMADAVLSTWQQGAYGLDKSDTVAVQIAVGREFKTGVGQNIQKDFDSVSMTTDGWPKTMGYDMPVMQAAVRSMYDHTQAHLDELGVHGGVTLHRGVGADIRGEVSIDLNAASSFSVDRATADSFADNQSDKRKEVGTYTEGGTRLTMTVPRQRILSMPGHGVGCYEEGEVVVLRGDGDRALAEEAHAGIRGEPWE